MQIGNYSLDLVAWRSPVDLDWSSFLECSLWSLFWVSLKENGRKTQSAFLKRCIYQNLSKTNSRTIAREARSRESLLYSGKSSSTNKCADGNDPIEREKLIMSEQRGELLKLWSWIGQRRWYRGSFSVSHNPLEGLSKHRLLGATPRGSDSVGLRWNLRICISKFPDNADAAGLGATLLEPLVYWRRGCWL